MAEMTGRSRRLVRAPGSKRHAGPKSTAAKRHKIDPDSLGYNLRAEVKSGDVSHYSGGDGDTSSDDHDESNVLGGTDKVSTVRYEKRDADGGSLETANLRERDHFNQGKKFVAIISDAASAGISLHADRRFKNSAREFT